MKLALIILSFFAVTVLPSSLDEEISQTIVNGEDADIKDFPYMAHIYTLIAPTCGASILTSRTVLTAAHCFPTIISRPFLVSVIVGSSYRDGRDGQSYRSSRITFHPEYVRGPNNYDVAVVQTISQIIFSPTVQPIPLAGSDYIGVDVPGVFTGFGMVRMFPPRSAYRLQKMYTTTVSNDDCRERYSNTNRGDYIFDQKLCIISGPRTSICLRDSGGALVINGTVAGVLSWRIFPCGNGLPDVFIRISAVREWIYSVLV